MRKVTKDICNAFMAKQARTIGNSHTDGQGLYLHGNLIAYHKDGAVMVSNAGWPTVTTRERLNGLPGVSVTQRKGIQYLNGQVWSGEFINPVTMEYEPRSLAWGGR